MRKNFTPVGTWVPLASLIFISTSCQKELDYTKDHGKGQTDIEGCNIRQISVHSSDDQTNCVYTFNYNAGGDPVSVRNTSVATGNPNAVFKYDRYGRLAEMIRPYENANYETWTKYSYNSKGFIIRDTQYVLGTFVDSVPVASPQLGYWVSQYTYDGLDRIASRTDSSFGFGGSRTGSTTLFHYDSNGNLSGGASYDTHLSFLRTNKIWMFLTSNYSVSNQFQASGYSSHELPITFTGPPQVMAPIVCMDGEFDVSYACDQMQK